MATNKEIGNVLIKLGVSPAIKGFDYLNSIISKCCESKEYLGSSVTKAWYPDTAKEFNTTPSRVERAVRHAIENVWDRGDVELLENLFGNIVSISKGKPTNSEFISLLVWKINNKEI